MYIIIYDFGTSSLKTCLFNIDTEITGRTIETVDNSQEAGAIGTALVVAAGIRGVDVLELAHQLVKANHTYTPNPENREIYEHNYKVFKKLYKANAPLFKELNT